MLAALTSRQVAELTLFYRMEPLGEERADIRNAMLMALIANMMRDSKTRPQPYVERDFMPFTRDEPDPEDQDALARAAVAQMKKGFERMAKKGQR